MLIDTFNVGYQEGMGHRAPSGNAKVSVQVFQMRHECRRQYYTYIAGQTFIDRLTPILPSYLRQALESIQLGIIEEVDLC